jgi:hypothetical protein
MKSAVTLGEQRRWMEQWRHAAVVLEEVRRYDLQTLTDEEAWQKIESLQSIPDVWRDPEKTSGLIEQQALFKKLR